MYGADGAEHHEASPADGLQCRRCLRPRDAEELDRMLWCDACRAAERHRASWLGRLAALLVAVPVIYWLHAAVIRSDEFLIFWVLFVIVGFLLIARLGRELIYGVIRARNAPGARAAKVAILLAGLLAAGCGTSPPAPPPVALDGVVATATTDVRVEGNAFELLDVIGARISAHPSGERAQASAAERFREYGLENVALEPFPLLGWLRGEASVTVLAPDLVAGRAVEVLSLGHVGDFVVEGPVVDAGHGTDAEIAALGDAARGAILLARVGSPPGYGRGVHRTEKITLATEAGAAGFLQVAPPGARVQIGVATLGDEATEIPAVSTDHESGGWLARLLARGEEVRVRMATRNVMEPMEAANVLGEIAGRTDEIVMVGAHLDSWDLATGAADNGTGTLVVLETARALAAHVARTGERPLRTIRFALFMGEELGLYGSRYHAEVRDASGELDRYRVMVNLDMIGAPVGFSAMGRPEAVELLSGLAAALRGHGPELETDVSTGGGLYSDHQPFLLRGIPIVGLRSIMPDAARGVGHTTADTRDKIDEPGLAASAVAASALLWTLANAPELPMRRWAESEIGARLDALGVRDPLERAGEWRW